MSPAKSHSYYFTEQVNAKQVVVVLAMEAREPGANEKAARLVEKYADKLGEMFATFHPYGLPGEGTAETLGAITRDDLVGQYIGHTAPKTKEILKKAMGGVLFIDEAYYLYRPENERDYGQEAIEILLQVMENQRDDLVVILAGYADRMNRFFESNPGFRSRIAHHIDFPDYDIDELMSIAHLMMEQQNYRFDTGAEDAMRAYLERRIKRPRFAHGRSVRNSIDRARLRQANRLFEQGGELTREQLMMITVSTVLVMMGQGVISPVLPLFSNKFGVGAAASVRAVADAASRRKAGSIGRLSSLRRGSASLDRAQASANQSASRAAGSPSSLPTERLSACARYSARRATTCASRPFSACTPAAFCNWPSRPTRAGASAPSNFDSPSATGPAFSLASAQAYSGSRSNQNHSSPSARGRAASRPTRAVSSASGFALAMTFAASLQVAHGFTRLAHSHSAGYGSRAATCALSTSVAGARLWPLGFFFLPPCLRLPALRPTSSSSSASAARACSSKSPKYTSATSS